MTTPTTDESTIVRSTAIPSAASTTPSTSPTPASRPLLRTSLLSLAIVAVGLALLPGIDLHRQPIGSVQLEWWAIAIAAIAGELMVFNIEFRREVYTFTFSEMPLLIGLFLATPSSLIIGRLVGAAAFLVVHEHQQLRKLTLNLASFFGECIVLLTVFELLGRPRDPEGPATWVIAVVAVCAADLLGFVVVAKAVRWHGGPLRLRSILAIGSVTAPVNSSLALVAVILLDRQPWAVLLLAGLAVFVLVAYRAYTALQQRHQSLSLLYDFTRMVSGAQQPDAVLRAILEQAKDLLRAERAEIWLSDDRGGHLGLAVNDDGPSFCELPDHVGARIERWFTASRGTTVITRKATDPERRAMADVLHADDCIIAPVTEAGRVVGLIAVVNRLGALNGFRAEEGPMFATLANHASVALENGRLIARLRQQSRQHEHDSRHDSLTGLPNRALFNEHLTAAIAACSDPIRTAGGTIGVALMDLDGFKEINDTLGHQFGDLALVEVAHRIQAVLRDGWLVARLGGDEFALLAPGLGRRAELDAVARRIRRVLAEPIDIDGVRVTTGISIGLALSPDDGVDAATVLQRADVAMYGAKAGLGDGVHFYDAMSDTNTPRRLQLTNDLRSAIVDNQLSLVFQPKVRLRDGGLLGVEALVRWTHPHLGAVSPEEFIPLAERSGVIVQITEFVLDHAIRQASRWHRDGKRWTMSVNLSMRNLLDPELVPLVRRLLRMSGLDPAFLTLEITETNVMADTSRTIDVLHRLAELGVHLSIDDFGTGYSSLSYLQRLPVHEVKIDRLFVQAMATESSAETIVRSILDLARNMGLDTVAEGIEDRSTWNRLRMLGCDQAQGYFVAHPMAASDLAVWDRSRSIDTTPVGARPSPTPRRTTVERVPSCARRTGT